ncbi:hypothetical protein B7P43_G07652 [Cryptotermes secundus]|uniref:Uncharacterized protein n=1 Tax=Cryptotermes secundus TaxID=105785 RepID=A0A2J7R2Y3_9NEOP|nr:hypothetical protein B7P43_G07652 [Cryptotermes secundus]
MHAKKTALWRGDVDLLVLSFSSTRSNSDYDTFLLLKVKEYSSDVVIMIIQYKSDRICLHAKLTAQRPITKLARVRRKEQQQNT